MRKMRNLHNLPKFADGLSFLYVEHARIEQFQKAIALINAESTIPIPCAQLAILMLGPGTSITHQAIKILAELNCTLLWTGEQGVRCYAEGLGKKRSTSHLLYQAFVVSNTEMRTEVVKNMYYFRFKELIQRNLTIAQLRGKEGARMRKIYQENAKRFEIEWKGRNYDKNEWNKGDPVNRAISTANACLYGICHAAILAAGYSPGMGFIHTGHQLAFVYDIADLYKAKITIPLAFKTAQEGNRSIEKRTRLACRDLFHSEKLLQIIIPDIKKVLSLAEPLFSEIPTSIRKSFNSSIIAEEFKSNFYIGEESIYPIGMWGSNESVVKSGVNYDPEITEEQE
jgi:CRISP-associated protein Cas1